MSPTASRSVSITCSTEVNVRQDTSHFSPHLTDAQQRSLRRVVANMIPESSEHGVPGADDPAIFADIVASLDREAAAVVRALARLDQLCDGVFADVDTEGQRVVLDRFRKAHPDLTTALVAATVRCYYRDDRVMRALGMEPRPPFPKGFDVAQGDWSLLEPVRARGKIFRDAP
jgi:hypothetical protein